MEQINIKNNAEFKSFLFILLFQRLIERQGPIIIFTQYKEGNVIIYPETMMFKFVKRIPNILLDRAIKINQGE